MEKDKSKATVLVISMGFLLIYILWSSQLFLYLSLIVGILGISDTMSKIIEKLWMGLAKLLSYIVPNILLTFIFYLILFPLGLIFRIVNKDPLLLSSDHETYWVSQEKEFDRESFEKPW